MLGSHSKSSLPLEWTKSKFIEAEFAFGFRYKTPPLEFTFQLSSFVLELRVDLKHEMQ